MASFLDGQRGFEAIEGLALVVGLIASLLIIGAAALRLYRNRLGRRRLLKREVEQLVPNAPLDWFRERLGAPVFTGKESGWRVLVWAYPVCYVQAVTRHDDEVVAFSVTTRARRWNPVFLHGVPFSANRPSGEVRLGRSTFGDVGTEPQGVYGFLGARRWGYSEAFYFGNPGLYRHYILSVNDAGYTSQQCDGIIDVLMEAGGVATGVLADRETFPKTTAPDENAYLAARVSAVPNTMTVTAPAFDLQAAGASLPIGVDLDQVRQFPG